MTDEETRQHIVEQQIKLLTASYDKAMAYTNLIIIAGYAGFFGLWNLCKDLLSQKQETYSALFMLCSLTIFVLFEVFKTFSIQAQNRKMAKIFFSPEANKTLETYRAALQTFEIEDKKSRIHFYRFWVCAFIPTLAFGILADGILVLAFILKLLN
jgi:hypothetical protein